MWEYFSAKSLFMCPVMFQRSEEMFLKNPALTGALEEAPTWKQRELRHTVSLTAEIFI